MDKASAKQETIDRHNQLLKDLEDWFALTKQTWQVTDAMLTIVDAINADTKKQQG